MITSKELFIRRRRRNRTALAKSSAGKLRLSVHRSSKNIYAQVIDDEKGMTLVSASTLDKDVRGKVKSGGNIEAAAMIGTLVAERAQKEGISSVVFDRGGYIYHGRVRALADAARDAGLKF
ncbi:MAG: 50S ribosomal protein L18 [Alphaproteobacteria bacterium]|jgi:large subunit ribosomal protein L18|nr:50S ribosomal protein L18 [Alphaproteobacteria bacterium]